MIMAPVSNAPDKTLSRSKPIAFILVTRECFDLFRGLILVSFHGKVTGLYLFNILPLFVLSLIFPLCVSLSPYSQRLLKSITPEPSSDQHRDLIVTNAV